jgi:hypothetical protein
LHDKQVYKNDAAAAVISLQALQKKLSKAEVCI